MSTILAHVNGALNDFLLLFCNALVLMFVWLGKYWRQQIGVKVANERARGILQRAESLAVAVVKRTFIEYVKPAKEAGKWTEAAQQEAITAAKAELRSHLGSKGMGELAWVMFGDSAPPRDVDPEDLLYTLLEAAIHDVKERGRALKPDTVVHAPLFPASSVPRGVPAGPLDLGASLGSPQVPTVQASTSTPTGNSPSAA